MPIDKTAATTVKTEPGDGKMSSRRTGTVKWFDALKGFGFITPTNPGDDDVFVYQADIYTPGNFRTLNQNEPVEYGVEVYDGRKIKAINVTGPQGGTVVGGSDPRPAAREQQRKEASFRDQEQRATGSNTHPAYGEKNVARIQIQRPAVPSRIPQQHHGLPSPSLLNTVNHGAMNSMVNPMQSPIHTLFGVQQMMGSSTIPTPEQYAIYYQNYQQQIHLGRVQAQHTHAHQVAIRAAQAHAVAQAHGAVAQAHQTQTSNGYSTTALATQAQAAWGFQQAQAAQAHAAQAHAANAANAAALTSWQSMPALLQAPGLNHAHALNALRTGAPTHALNAAAASFGPMQAPRSSSSERPAPYGQNPGTGARGSSKVSRL